MEMKKSPNLSEWILNWKLLNVTNIQAAKIAFYSQMQNPINKLKIKIWLVPRWK